MIKPYPRPCWPAAPDPGRILHGSRRVYLGFAGIAIGLGAWGLNEYLLETDHAFYIKLALLGPLGFFGGLLVLIRPGWAGPITQQSTKDHKIAVCTLIALLLIVSGADMARLQGYWHLPRLGMFPAKGAAPDVQFMGRVYRLASFNKKAAATWEFLPAGEAIQRWTTLMTLVERADGHTRADVDRVAEGVKANYQAHGSQILMAKTMRDAAGKPYDYMVAAFEEPAFQRYELNFVKIALGEMNNVIVAVYSVRIADPVNAQKQAKLFLTRESDGIGKALAEMSPAGYGKTVTEGILIRKWLLG